MPGVSSRTISVNILPDEIVEANEVFSLGLTTQAGSPLTVGTPGTTLITIDDDDGMCRHSPVIGYFMDYGVSKICQTFLVYLKCIKNGTIRDLSKI